MNNKSKQTKLNITNIKIDRKDILTVIITTIFVGLIVGLIAYTYLPIYYAILIAIASGILLGMIVNWARVNLLSGVTYPTLKSLAELTIYIIIAGAVIAMISLGLDLIFVRIRDALL